MSTNEPGDRNETAAAPRMSPGPNRAGSIALAIAVVAAILCAAVFVSADYGMKMLSKRLQTVVSENAEPSRGRLEKVEQEFHADFYRTSPVMSTLADSGLLLLAALVFAGACTAIIGLLRSGYGKKSALAALVLCAVIVAAYCGYFSVRWAQMQREIPNVPSWYWSK
jgi:uncharacterized membrane protein